jgi:hypothetical protein
VLPPEDKMYGLQYGHRQVSDATALLFRAALILFSYFLLPSSPFYFLAGYLFLVSAYDRIISVGSREFCL